MLVLQQWWRTCCNRINGKMVRQHQYEEAQHSIAQHNIKLEQKAGLVFSTPLHQIPTSSLSTTTTTTTETTPNHPLIHNKRHGISLNNIQMNPIRIPRQYICTQPPLRILSQLNPTATTSMIFNSKQNKTKPNLIENTCMDKLTCLPPTTNANIMMMNLTQY